MKKEILEQAVSDYINEKFKDRVLDKRLQTFFIYSELVDTVLSFAELLNKNIEMLENENAELKELLNCNNCSELSEEECEVCAEYSHFKCKRKEQIAKVKELLNACIFKARGNVNPSWSELITEIEQFLREIDIGNTIQKANEGLNLDKIADEVEQDIKEQNEVTIASVWEKRDEVPLKLKVSEVYTEKGEYKNKQLTQAKEIIKGLLPCCRNYPEENAEKIKQAEQFLKENEKCNM